jgi:hypothetical protein
VVTASGIEVDAATNVVPMNVPPKPLASATLSAVDASIGAATRIPKVLRA